jgi:hypothetical protein
MKVHCLLLLSSTVVVSADCEGWRQTANCDPYGAREPANDKACTYEVPSIASGFCDCGGGRNTSHVTCEHTEFTCEAMCNVRHEALETLNLSNPVWIVSTSTSRDSNEMLYMLPPTDDYGALRGWGFDESRSATLWLIPGSAPDRFFIVGTLESRYAGRMAYVKPNLFGNKGDIYGKPYHPDNDPEEMKPYEWQFVRAPTRSNPADEPAYYIVTVPESE